MHHLDLFSGIGGFALAIDTVWSGSTHTFVDNDPFCQAILKKHWPNSEIYGDIQQLITDTERKRFQRVGDESELQKPAKDSGCFILTGGFPCQPFSQAGRRKGTSDDRYLWPEMFRVIQLTQPTWVIAENVRGLVTWNDGLVLEQVCTDLESEGYEVQSLVIPAVAVNAPHRRDRIWFIAFNAEHNGWDGSQDGQGGATGNNGDTTRQDEVQQPPRPDRQGDDATNATNNDGGSRRQREEVATIGTSWDNEPARRSWNQNWIEVATRLCTLDDGLPNGLARPRGWRNAALKGAGNAIVPQVAIEIMKAISHVTERE